MEPIKVIKETIMSVSIKLSPFKEWICRVFKIEPARLYENTAVIHVDKPEALRPGFMLLDETGNKWLVTHQSREVYIVATHLKGIEAGPQLRRIGSVVVFAQAAKEN